MGEGIPYDEPLELERFDIVTATFQPQRTDTLVDGAAEWIGRRLRWEAVWIIERASSYRGQWAMRPMVRETPPFGWAPFSDLADVEPWDEDNPDA
jgi:hypothetical protein